MLPTLSESLTYSLDSVVMKNGTLSKMVHLSIEASEEYPGYWDYKIIDSVEECMWVSTRPITFEGLCEHIIPRYGLDTSHELSMYPIVDEAEKLEEVYCVNQQGTDYYKIGRSYSVSSRVTTLQAGNPYPLVVVYTIPSRNAAKLESSLHKRFKNQRLEGEWFLLSKDDLNIIKSEYKEEM